MKRDEILDTVKKTICQDRQDVHGNPEDTHALIAYLWNNYWDARCGVDRNNPGHLINGGFMPQDVAVMMCLFKIARHAMNPAHTDNLHDLIGYAAIAAEISQSQG